MLLDKYRHLRSLCQQHGIKVSGNDVAIESRAYHDRKRGVVFPPPRSEADYLAALHEIGHYVVPGAIGAQSGAARWKEEILASRWALANAKDLTDEGIDFLAGGLYSYSVDSGYPHDKDDCRRILTETED